MKKSSISQLTLLALFSAIILLMDFTPLGYITTGAFSVTLMTIPVAVGAICTGPLGGAYLGALFGLTSFLQCFGIGFMIDPSAQLMFSTSPWRTAVNCFVPRILAGLIAGMAFDSCRRLLHRENAFVYAVPCSLLPILNTVFFLTAYYYLFRGTALTEGMAIRTIFAAVIALNGLIELGITLIVGVVICLPIRRVMRRYT